MYADAIMFGMDEFPEVPAEARKQINLFYQTHGLKALQRLLLEKDPKYYSRVDINNPIRLFACIRSLYCLRPALFLIFRKNRDPNGNFVFKNDRTPQS